MRRECCRSDERRNRLTKCCQRERRVLVRGGPAEEDVRRAPADGRKSPDTSAVRIFRESHKGRQIPVVPGCAIRESENRELRLRWMSRLGLFRVPVFLESRFWGRESAGDNFRLEST